MNSIDSLAADPPATVDILQRVKPGCEADFEAVLADLIAAAQGFDGHLGVRLMIVKRPRRFLETFEVWGLFFHGRAHIGAPLREIGQPRAIAPGFIPLPIFSRA